MAIVRNCKLCGAEFRLDGKKDGARRYCCKEHAKEYWEVNKREYDKKYYQSHVDRFRTPKRELICGRCGNKFTGHGNAKYCNDCLATGNSFMRKLYYQRKAEIE